MKPNKDLQDAENPEMSNYLTFSPKSLITANKEQITDIAKSIVGQVSRGEIDPVKSFGQAKKISELATLLVNNLRPYMADHIHVSKGETAVYDGIEYTQAETGVSYDYSVCGDVVYDDILKRFKEVEKEKKDREAFLKTIKKPTGQFNEETSEVWTVKPPLKKGQTSVKSELR